MTAVPPNPFSSSTRARAGGRPPASTWSRSAERGASRRSCSNPATISRCWRQPPCATAPTPSAWRAVTGPKRPSLRSPPSTAFPTSASPPARGTTSPSTSASTPPTSSGALDAFLDGQERRIDLGRVNGRLFVNNVAMGVYGAIVQSPAYRDHKVRTVIDMLPELVGPGAQPFDLRFNGRDGRAHDSAVLVLVSNNRYGVDPRPRRGTRGDLDARGARRHRARRASARGSGPNGRHRRFASTRRLRLRSGSTARASRWSRRSSSSRFRWRCGSGCRSAGSGDALPSRPPGAAKGRLALPDRRRDGLREGYGGCGVGRARSRRRDAVRQCPRRPRRRTGDHRTAPRRRRRAESGALVLAGPPGIGKSTLVQYAIDSASGFRVLRVTGVESEMAFGYAGVHQLVLPILDGLPASSPNPNAPRWTPCSERCSTAPSTRSSSASPC